MLRIHRSEMGSATPLLRATATAESRLPPEDAAAFGAIIRRDAPRYTPAAQHFAEARQELEHQIVSEPLDQAEARKALTNLQDAINRFISIFGDTLIEALAKVSPEGRRKLVAERRLARESSSLR